MKPIIAAFLFVLFLAGSAWAQEPPSGAPVINQAASARAVTKSDSTIIPKTRGLFIGDATACNVAVRFYADPPGSPVTFTNVQSGAILPFSVVQVMSTSTTCAAVTALY